MGNYIKLFTMIISLFVLIPIAFSIQDSELAHDCSLDNYNTSYNNNSSYAQSLTHLITDLCDNAPNHNGSSNASSSVKWDPNEKVYGIALCRGDVSPDVCKTCLQIATTTVTKERCPHSRRAIILRNCCLFKYSDIDFRGQTDPQIYYNSDPSGDEYKASNTTYGEAAVGLLSNLSKTAIETPDKLFANGAIETGNGTLYAIVQCTGDLSVGYCGECLKEAIDDILYWCMNKLGVYVVYGSCSLRYNNRPLN